MFVALCERGVFIGSQGHAIKDTKDDYDRYGGYVRCEEFGKFCCIEKAKRLSFESLMI